MEFSSFVLEQLPAAPARVLEVGCGKRGGVAPALAEAGYDVVGVDPAAPEGPLFRQVTIEEFDDAESFDAVVAGRVLHHLRDLDAVLAKLARLAPLVVVDEFAWDRIDEATQGWYEGQHRMLVVAGHEPKGPGDLEQWRWAHRDLHPSNVVLAALRARYDERTLEWRPYLYRWLGGPAAESLEDTLVNVRAIEPTGYRFVGERR